MDNEEVKKTIELIRKSREEIGDKYNELAQKLDNDLKGKLSEEQYRVWSILDGSLEEEQKLIEEIGEERYSELLSEITKILDEDLKK